MPLPSSHIVANRYATATTRRVLLLALGLLVAACADQGGPSECSSPLICAAGGGATRPGIVFEDTVGAADAMSMGYVIADLPIGIIQRMQPTAASPFNPSISWPAGAPGLPARGSAGPTFVTGSFPPILPDVDGCLKSIRGAAPGDPYRPLDRDGDGIPDDWRIRFECRSFGPANSAGKDVHYTNVFEMWTKERAGGVWGFDAGRTQTLTRSEGLTLTIVTFDSTTQQLWVRPDSAVYLLHHHFTVATSVGGDPQHPAAALETTQASFHAKGGPIVQGAPFPSGVFRLSGRYDRVYFGPALSFTYDTPERLVYDPSCTYWNQFTHGRIHGQLNGRDDLASFDALYQGCVAPYVTLTGVQPSAGEMPGDHTP